MSGSTVPAPPRRSLGGVFVFVLLAAAAAGGVYAYQYYTERNATRQTDVDFGTLVRTSLRYLDDPADPAVWKDVDGDLVADTPSDEAQLLGPDTLVFAPLSGGSPDAEAAWKEFTDHLAKATGKKVAYQAGDQMQVTVKDLREGTLHVAGISTGSMPAAVRAGFVPCAVPASADGKSGFHVYILVPADSPIKSPSDLKGRTLTLTSNGSYSGYKAPLILLKDKFNLEAQRDYQFNRSGGHDQSIKGLAKKEYEAVAIASDMLRRAEARGDIQSGQYRSIYESDQIPPGCYGYHHRLRPELAAKVREAFLSFAWKGTGLEKAMGASGETKFAAVDYKKDWQFVRDSDQKLLDWAKAAGGPAAKPKAPKVD